jgi:putative membrane protein
VLSLKTSPAFAMGFGLEDIMGGSGMGGFGGIFMFIFWGLVLVGAFFLVKAFLQASGMDRDKQRTSPKALEVLRDRYARGEIDKIEFEQKKQDLKAI